MKTAFLPLVALAAVVACPEPPSPAEFLPELRKGGYVLSNRHPKSEPDQAELDRPVQLLCPAQLQCLLAA
jgi:hypothetical protein